MAEVILTEFGFELLRKEYQRLKTVVRADLIDELKQAKEDNNCDLSENIEFANANENLNRIEEKIQELEKKLEIAKVVKESDIVDDGVVRFGKTIKVLRLSDNKELTWKIVGEEESDVKRGLVSYKAPLIQNMMKLEAGDIADFNDIEYEILSVKK